LTPHRRNPPHHCGSRTINRDSVESPRNVSEIPRQLGLPDLRSETGKMPAKINLEVTSLIETLGDEST